MRSLERMRCCRLVSGLSYRQVADLELDCEGQSKITMATPLTAFSLLVFHTLHVAQLFSRGIGKV